MAFANELNFLGFLNHSALVVQANWSSSCLFSSNINVILLCISNETFPPFMKALIYHHHVVTLTVKRVVRLKFKQRKLTFCLKMWSLANISFYLHRTIQNNFLVAVSKKRLSVFENTLLYVIDGVPSWNWQKKTEN